MSHGTPPGNGFGCLQATGHIPRPSRPSREAEAESLGEGLHLRTSADEVEAEERLMRSVAGPAKMLGWRGGGAFSPRESIIPSPAISPGKRPPPPLPSPPNPSPLKLRAPFHPHPHAHTHLQQRSPQVNYSLSSPTPPSPLASLLLSSLLFSFPHSSLLTPSLLTPLLHQSLTPLLAPWLVLFKFYHWRIHFHNSKAGCIKRSISRRVAS